MTKIFKYPIKSPIISHSKKLFLLLGLIILLQMSFSSGALADDLVTYYKFDETSGTTASDEQNNNTGTLNNSRIFTSNQAGIDGQSADFSLGDDYINTTLKWDHETSSISYWVFVNVSQNQVVFGNRQSTNANPIANLNINATGNPYVTFRANGGGALTTATSNVSIPLKTWSSVIVTYNSSDNVVKLYVNGELTANDTHTGGTWSNVNRHSIGAEHPPAGWTNHLNGSVDEFRYYQRIITNNEIKRLSRSVPETLINSPTSPTIKNVNLNVTSEDYSATATLKNVTLYINGTANETKSISGNENISLFENKFNQTGRYILSFITCNTDDECGTSDNTTMDVQNFEEVAIYAPASTSEGLSETFTVEVNTATNIDLLSANLVYDGTEVYSSSIADLGGGSYNLSTTFTIPAVSSTTNKGFYFNFSLSDSTTYNSTNTSITVNEVDIDSCGVFSIVLYNFTVYDEKTLAKLSGASDSVNTTIAIDVYDNAYTTLIENYSVVGTDSNPIAVCLEDTLITGSDYKVDVQVQYWADAYAKEFYNIVRDDLTEADLNTNISLYLLDNASSQIFKITYKDSSFLPVENAVIQIQRKYIGENLFRTVEQPKTDSNGETLAHLELNDAVYTIIVLVNNIVDATFNNIIAVCQNPALDECEVPLNAVESFVDPIDFTTIQDFSFTGPTYNKSNRQISTIFSVTSGTVGFIEMNVTHLDGLGTTQVCADSITSSSGTLTCTVPNSFGNSTVVVTLYQDGVKVVENIISLAQDPSDIYGDNLVVIGIVIFISLLGIGIVGNPVISGLFLILSSIVLVALNVFYSPGFIGGGATILWFIVAVILVIIKGANR